jgi:predicted phosphodiesterase
MADVCWKEWALEYKEKHGLTFVDLCSTVNGEFDMNMNVNTFRRTLGEYKKELINKKAERFDLLSQLIKDIPPFDIPEMSYNRFQHGCMVEVHLTDLHIGKMAYNTREDSSERVKTIVGDYVADVIANVKDLNVDFFLLPVGNDLLHFDDTKGHTTGGTLVNGDQEWQQMFVVALECMIYIIEQLSVIAPVKVLFVPGNHDKATSFYLTKAIEMRYFSCSHVSVDTRTKKRKYFKYGNTLIGFTHGESEKNRLPYLMQIEAPKEWGESKYREFHMGHLHSESLEEVGGIKFRRLPSLSETDEWHYENGYIGAVKSSATFVYDFIKGLKRIEYFNL